MLFQPTNIFPDLKNGAACGTIDIDLPLEVFWQVNGNTPMTKYQIKFCLNDAESTELGTYGPITLQTPFSGTDYMGNKVPFEVEIPTSTISGYGIINGNEYKMYITQWYSGGSITQSSASVFQTRSTPTVSISNFSQTVTKREVMFEGEVSQLEGDAINWVRWEIAYANDRDNVIADTHEIYGTSDIRMFYDGFFSGVSYSIKCTIETENGVQATTGWQDFDVDYSTSELTGNVSVSKKSSESSAVLVSWSGFRYIHGKATAGSTYSLNGGKINLPRRMDEIYWDDVNGSSMSLQSPWNIVYKGTLSTYDATLFSVTTTGGNRIDVVYDIDSRSIYVNNNSSTMCTMANVRYNSPITIILTPSRVYLRGTYLVGGLYPALNRYPSATLYPSGDDTVQIDKRNTAISYTQSAISKVSISGSQTCDFIQVISGTISSDIIDQAYNNDTYIPNASVENTEFLADFDGDLDAGTLYVGGSEIKGWAVYRHNIDTNKFVHVVDTPMLTTQFYDYSLASNTYRYKYYVYPIGIDTYITSPFESNEIRPCFKNWYIIECSKDDNGKYQVVDEYAFGKNLSTSEISNNNTPGIMSNFTRFPTVQISTQNYMSGNLQSLIGEISNGEYSDTKELRDKIFSLSTTNRSLVLKSRKGDVIFVRTSGEISIDVMDNSACQAQTVKLPWIQVGEAENENIISI